MRLIAPRRGGGRFFGQRNSGWLSNDDLETLAIAMAAMLAADAMEAAGKSLVHKLKRRKRGKLTRH